jgi:phosphoribosylformylglycinamidine cyclo-ligase
VKLALELIRSTSVHALAHVTGGGLPGNLPRVLPATLAAHVDAGSWPVPAIFRLVQEAAGIDDHEMMRTFNLGIGMVAVVPEASVEAVRKAAAGHDVPCFPIGRIVTRADGAGQFELLPAPGR